MLEAGQPDQLEVWDGPLAALRLRQPLELEPKFGVLDNRLPREQVESLENHRPLTARPRNSLAEYGHVALVVAGQASQDP